MSDEQARMGRVGTSLEADAPTRPKQADKSLGELFGDLTSEMGDLVRKEIELAKVEARDDLKQLGRGAGMFAGAGLGGWMTALFISLALAWWIDQGLNTALSFAIVGAVWALIAVVLYGRGRQEIKGVGEPLPETRQTLKEDVQWVKTQTS